MKRGACFFWTSLAGKGIRPKRSVTDSSDLVETGRPPILQHGRPRAGTLKSTRSRPARPGFIATALKGGRRGPSSSEQPYEPADRLF